MPVDDLIKLAIEGGTKFYDALKGRKLTQDEWRYLSLVVWQSGIERLSREYRRGIERLSREYRGGIERLSGEYRDGTGRVVDKIDELATEQREGLNNVSNHMSSLESGMSNLNKSISSLDKSVVRYYGKIEGLIQGLLLGKGKRTRLKKKKKR